MAHGAGGVPSQVGVLGTIRPRRDGSLRRLARDRPRCAQSETTTSVPDMPYAKQPTLRKRLGKNSQCCRWPTTRDQRSAIHATNSVHSPRCLRFTSLPLQLFSRLPISRPIRLSLHRPSRHALDDACVWRKIAQPASDLAIAEMDAHTVTTIMRAHDMRVAPTRASPAIAWCELCVGRSRQSEGYSSDAHAYSYTHVPCISMRAGWHHLCAK